MAERQEKRETARIRERWKGRERKIETEAERQRQREKYRLWSLAAYLARQEYDIWIDISESEDKRRRDIYSRLTFLYVEGSISKLSHHIRFWFLWFFLLRMMFDNLHVCMYVQYLWAFYFTCNAVHRIFDPWSWTLPFITIN